MAKKKKGWKDCPLCEERIEASAKRCRHCGSTLVRTRGAGPGLDPAVFPEVPDMGLPGLTAVTGALLGFAAGAPFLGWRHALAVLLGAALGFWGGRLLLVWRAAREAAREALAKTAKAEGPPPPADAAREPASEAASVGEGFTPSRAEARTEPATEAATATEPRPSGSVPPASPGSKTESESEPATESATEAGPETEAELRPQ